MPASQSPIHLRSRLHGVLLFALSLLMGCAGTGAGGSGETAIQLQNCENLGGNFAVPFDQARAALPEGFEPLPTTGGSAAGAVFYVIAVRCAAGQLGNRELGEVQLAYAELAARPPEAAQFDGLADATVPVLFTATPAALADAFSGMRFGQAGPGTIVWESTATGTQVQFTVGDAMVTLNGQVPDEPASELGAGEFALYGVANRQVLSRVRGYAGAALSVRGPVSLQSSGGPALLGQAAPTARGFVARGFDLGFTPVD